MAEPIERKSVAELEKLHTGTLMKRREALLQCPEPPEPLEGNEVATGSDILYKNTPQWNQAYRDLKAVLENREHMPNKQQRRAIRQERARKK
ncbi:MAG: hypothetical protein R3280_08095 [Marinobacter sp.]|uniref:hypothetical protein n=1 Tax=Marinobacter sp. TaxID=50741 RepID=UPI00299E1461|nr:hypothetical protein [Marinobacter sp.]MDX1634581.1 hypothetical protein [Marinobacter sp.]